MTHNLSLKTAPFLLLLAGWFVACAHLVPGLLAFPHDLPASPLKVSPGIASEPREFRLTSGEGGEYLRFVSRRSRDNLSP